MTSHSSRDLESKWKQIERNILSSIIAGRWPPGSYLPGLPKLCEEYDAKGMNTVRRAQKRLTDRGILRPIRGVGVLVLRVPEEDEPDLSPAAMMTRLDDLQRRLDVLSTELRDTLKAFREVSGIVD